MGLAYLATIVSATEIWGTSGTERYGTKLIIEIWWARIQNESVGLGVAPRGRAEFLFEMRHKLGTAHRPASKGSVLQGASSRQFSGSA